MNENSHNLSRHDLQALLAQIFNRLDSMEERLLSQQGQKQATYTVGQFAKATGLTYDCVLQRCQNGKLNARQDKPGARWTINGDELDRYLREGKENRW